VLTTDALGRPYNKLDHTFKKRRDLLLDRDHPMHVRLAGIIMKRCAPEIKRAFQAVVTHTDRLLIACYPGDGGHFRRHRDNRPKVVSFRRFAPSINLTLDAEGYEGGHLRLPEFNSHHYRCPPGAGVIFSVALLHEITPVLRGDRYVLVTHLHDDEGEVQWLAYRAAMAAVRTAG
jgi:predicted 2-oxoglutarate/Fe(II)-dependent dioxygenase YbiX